MNKSELIYVIVRLSGVVFLALAVLSILNFATGVLLVSGTPAENRFTTALTLDAIIRISVEIIVGLYLIVDGGLLFWILNREND